MIEAIKNGSRFAYEQAYVQHREKVYAYFLKKTNNEEDAKDLLQQVFLKLWQYRSSLSTDYLLEQHIFHIARTVFIDYLRVCNKRSALQKKLEEKPAFTYTSSVFDIKKHMQLALSSMPELRKKVFELNRLQGYSYKEIAEMLSISVKSVDNNLSKALKQLKKVLVFVVFILTVFKN